MKPPPVFSVVIPTYQRPPVLAKSLDLLTPELQGVAADRYEVIVADDSRDDATERMVRERYPQVRYVRGPRRGPGPNRNAGAGAATGEWISFIDDDCQPQPDWLGALARANAARRVDVIEGAILAPEKIDSPFRHYGENVTGGVYWSGNLSIRRELFQRLGGFDEDFTEAAGDDLEFAARIRRAAVPMMFCPEAAVVHPTHVVSWRYVVWHVFAIRWHLLYVIKTGEAPPPEAPIWKTVPYLIGNRLMYQLRVTWRALRHPDRDRPRTAFFNLGLQWIMMPVLLPYMVVWDQRFRRMLRERRSAAMATKC